MARQRRHVASSGLQRCHASPGDKGVLITPGTFTADAEREVTRDGAPPVDLIDGQTLCDLLAERGIAVKREPVVTYQYENISAVFREMGLVHG